jgi:hypothetical protein
MIGEYAIPPASTSSPQNEDSHQELFQPLKVMCEINGVQVPAIIDTGAQISIMSLTCARRCGIVENIDTRFQGRALGVGASAILGRIDGLATRIGPVNFQSRVSILDNARVDLLIGLDFLQRFRGEINLKENVLKFQVREKTIRVPFLSSSGYDMSTGPVRTQRAPPEREAPEKERYDPDFGAPADAFDTDEEPSNAFGSSSSTCKDIYREVQRERMLRSRHSSADYSRKYDKKFERFERRYDSTYGDSNSMYDHSSSEDDYDDVPEEEYEDASGENENVDGPAERKTSLMFSAGSWFGRSKDHQSIYRANDYDDDVEEGAGESDEPLSMEGV